MKEALDGLDLLREAFDQECKRAHDWREKHDREALDFRIQILSEIQPFKEFRLSLSWFWRIVLGISGLTWSVIKGAAWLKEHLK